jgi:hypothetical protein
MDALHGQANVLEGVVLHPLSRMFAVRMRDPGPGPPEAARRKLSGGDLTVRCGPKPTTRSTVSSAPRPAPPSAATSAAVHSGPMTDTMSARG